MKWLLLVLLLAGCTSPRQQGAPVELRNAISQLCIVAEADPNDASIPQRLKELQELVRASKTKETEQ